MKDLLVFLAEGFEEIEALTVVDYLRRAGAEVVLAAVGRELLVKSSHGVQVKADAVLRRLDPSDFKAVYIPGGLPGARNLAGSATVRAWVNQFNADQKLIAAICAGPLVLDKLSLLKPGKYTCYPGFEKELKTEGRIDKAVAKDKHIWTSMGPAFAQHLALELVTELRGKKAAEQLSKDLLYPKLRALVKDQK